MSFDGRKMDPRFRGDDDNWAVIPAKAGIQCLLHERHWIPAFAGMTSLNLRSDPWRFKPRRAPNLSVGYPVCCAPLRDRSSPVAPSRIAPMCRSSIGSDRPLTEDDLVDAPWRHPDRSREGILADPHRGQKFFQQNLTGMDVG